MASGCNKTVLIGRVGQKPKRNDDGVVSFTLCNNTIGVGGKEEVMWHRIVSKDKQGDLCEKYLDKGDLCCIEGKLCKKDDSKSKFSNVILCETLVLLTNKKR